MGRSWRYEQGKQVIKEVFGLEVIEMAHTLSGSEYVDRQPKERADDLMEAFKDNSIKAIFNCIGDDNRIRLLPCVGLGIIEKNPKILIGHSDTTIGHLMCFKAGLSSFYGPSLLAEFAKNGGMFEYAKNCVQKMLFETDVGGEIKMSWNLGSEYLHCDYELCHQRR
ncbi:MULTISPECIES: LD-carboxypeptidase [Turicibacter]|uniref:LD-carboxypeptidase n=1 Tax=Turicibacter TaxID=191303 RepID=UPI0001FDB3E0|nr:MULTISPECIES: LD-carboxypeptidase [Turicibacter]EGC90922.1 hypothetical protein HMPREF9402_0095 [Turicibacter sp. HGF1]MBP3905180.1 LD-carboxypeptidase [Turicibacter sp.]MCU7198187.1 LD-carboxypeptidase [Turicibacter sanguinis]MDB8458234.1 LD-carboxypeptidase [Turicibacter sanguinis]MDB8555297.1 LD-carboxypeptidase [Turicibacter sanguinis]